MSTELAPHRKHLNALPLLMAPGVGLVGCVLGGPLAAVECMALWCGLLALATATSARRYAKHKVHETWNAAALVTAGDDRGTR